MLLKKPVTHKPFTVDQPELAREEVSLMISGSDGKNQPSKKSSILEKEKKKRRN